MVQNVINSYIVSLVSRFTYFDKGGIWEIENISPDLVFAENADTCITKPFPEFSSSSSISSSSSPSCPGLKRVRLSYFDQNAKSYILPKPFLIIQTAILANHPWIRNKREQITSAILSLSDFPGIPWPYTMILFLIKMTNGFLWTVNDRTLQSSSLL